MIRESFYEESCKIIDIEAASKKRMKFLIASTICLVIGLAAILFGWTTIDDTERTLAIFFILLIPGTLFLILGIFLWHKKNGVFVEYDYTILTDEIRIAKIINQKDRRRVIDFDISKIERIGKVNSSTYFEYVKDLSVKKLVLTKNKFADKGKDFFYLVVNTEKGKKLLVIECTENFIARVLSISGRFVLEKDYK